MTTTADSDKTYSRHDHLCTKHAGRKTWRRVPVAQTGMWRLPFKRRVVAQRSTRSRHRYNYCQLDVRGYKLSTFLPPYHDPESWTRDLCRLYLASNLLHRAWQRGTKLPAPLQLPTRMTEDYQSPSSCHTVLNVASWTRDSNGRGLSEPKSASWNHDSWILSCLVLSCRRLDCTFKFSPRGGAIFRTI